MTRTDHDTATRAAALTERRRRSRDRLARWAHWLDDAVRVPVVGVRIGVDALVGLIPVAGDFAGLLLSSALVAEAIRLRAPPRLLLRMGLNLGLDFAVGLIPVLGDVADVAWRANRRNRRLLEDWIDRELAPPARRAGWRATVALAAGLLLAAALSLWLVRALTA